MEFSWSFGDSMVVGPSIKRKSSLVSFCCLFFLPNFAGPDEPFFHLTVLQPNFNYDDPFIRKLIHESHSKNANIINWCAFSLKI